MAKPHRPQPSSGNQYHIHPHVSLDAEAAGLRAQRAARARRERQLAKASLAKLSLPPPPASEQILRYEAAIQREYYRALHQLERLQRRRHGEFVPPPVSAQLSVAGDEAPGGGESADAPATSDTEGRRTGRVKVTL